LNSKDVMRQSFERTQSRVVLALDLEIQDPQMLIEKSRSILSDVKEYICGVKINRQLLLSLGLPTLRDIVSQAHEYSLPVIMDAKLNDVGHTNAFMMRSFVQAGFDAVIASPVPGWEDGMDSVFDLARKEGKAVILLVYMSNPGAERFYSMMVDGPRRKPIFEHFAELAVQWKAHGVVVGATRPAIISRVRSLVGKIAIYSPGIGTQGGDAREALDAGATYLIVGRTIFAAARPEEAARRLCALTRACHQN
jgi:orotidine-5'-phosphate decarboxylase